ncbi:MAG: metal-dependent hydrolase [Acidimicrobiales bacterium]
MTVSAAPTARRIEFDYGDDFDADWHPRLPEFAAVANAVSLQMPAVEPFVALAVRARLDELDGAGEEPALADAAAGYCAQELEHHAQHRRLNQHLIAATPALARVEAWLASAMGRLEAHRSGDLGVAFAVAFEAMAYAGARWVDARLRRLLDGADPLAATLFVWHLAEEVEHKSVADDVARALGVRRRDRLLGGVLAFLVLSVFTVLGLVPQLWRTRRLWHPVALARLVGWAVSFAFELLPALVLSVFEAQRPADLADPAWMERWLTSHDPSTRTLPLWNELA